VSKQDTRTRIQQDVLELLQEAPTTGLRPKEIARRLDYRNDRLYGLFRDVLDDMDAEHEVRRLKGNKYIFNEAARRPGGSANADPAAISGDSAPAEDASTRNASNGSPDRSSDNPNEAEGVIDVHENGFAFVTVEGWDEDVYVAANNVGTALHGDRVRLEVSARPSHDSHKREGRVLEVTERKRDQTVGTFLKKGHFAFVEPDDGRVQKDIYVPEDAFGEAHDGQKVLVSIDRYDESKANPEGRVLRVIGDGDDPGVRVLSLAMSLDVKAEFPRGVEDEAAEIPTAIPDEEYQRRLDLREKRIFTIDPEDAKDFDDAVHVKELPNGNREVGVHIADVSHYVDTDTVLDDEALKRGNSVYLVDRTIPMLPEKLSNRVCSLRPEEDKLAFSCIMEVTPQGDVKSHELRETVIRSKHRFTYDEAQTFIDGGRPDHPFASDVVDVARLSRTLTRKRMREGSVDFDRPEVRVILDDDGHPTDVVRKERKRANRLIEELMLMANRTVAERIAGQSDPPPFVYRVHDTPDAEQIQQLAEYVRAFDYELELENGNVRSHNLNALLQAAKGASVEPIIEDAALRAMSKAEYATENIGHYGLGFEHYTHFTSPIRRYPDLMVHRLLKRYATGSGARANEDELDAACKHCSERERVAQDAERESVKLKQVEYARDHLGDEFDGVVRGVTKFGVFVELNALLVEGLVHVRDMNDYFEYDEDNFVLTGERSGRSYRPGDEVRVQLAAANVEKREIDLLFV
jgi:ribonuclease R